MRYLRLTSVAITLLGAALFTVAWLGELGAAPQIAGILLAWAGIVKIVVVHLWTHVAGLGSDRHDPLPPT